VRVKGRVVTVSAGNEIVMFELTYVGHPIRLGVGRHRQWQCHCRVRPQSRFGRVHAGNPPVSIAPGPGSASIASLDLVELLSNTEREKSTVST
jgi:hypothetical protein